MFPIGIISANRRTFCGEYVSYSPQMIPIGIFQKQGIFQSGKYDENRKT